MKNFHYHNKEVKNQSGGHKIVRTVKIKGGKGTKSVTHYHKGKKIHTSQKSIRSKEIKMIMSGKFIPGLFSNMTKRIRSLDRI